MEREPLDTQVIELIGRNRLGSELLHAGLEIAVPARDRGIDLIVYADLSSQVKAFTACPIQMKAASNRSFSLFRKYEKFANLIIAYVWFVDDPQKTETYALTYPEALEVATEMGWTKTESWARDGYSTTSPSDKLLNILAKHRMTKEKWREKVVGTSIRAVGD
jgi:hypothetical protein